MSEDLIKLIRRLEELREEFTITYDGLAEVVEVMKNFDWETEKNNPLRSSEKK